MRISCGTPCARRSICRQSRASTRQGKANQDVTFLTDGGEAVRALTELVPPEAEHVLDWFHIAVRLTVLEQHTRGVAHHDAAA